MAYSNGSRACAGSVGSAHDRLDDVASIRGTARATVRRRAARALVARLGDERRRATSRGAADTRRRSACTPSGSCEHAIAPAFEQRELRALALRSLRPCARAQRAAAPRSMSRISLPMYCIWRRARLVARDRARERDRVDEALGQVERRKALRRRARPARRPDPAARASSCLRLVFDGDRASASSRRRRSRDDSSGGRPCEPLAGVERETRAAGLDVAGRPLL